jgi:hypothetical protein
MEYITVELIVIRKIVYVMKRRIIEAHSCVSLDSALSTKFQDTRGR